MKWVIDLSSYQNLTDDQWKKLADNGMAGVVIKSSQGTAIRDSMLETHVNKATRFKIPYGLYHWSDPIRSYLEQVQIFTGLIKTYKPTCAWSDAEQYWSNWTLYWKYMKDKITYVPRFSTDQMLTFYYNFSFYLKPAVTALGFPVKLGIYSAPWFVNGWCKPLASVINNYFYWNYSRRWPGNDSDGDKSLDLNEIQGWVDSLKLLSTDYPAGVRQIHLWQLGDYVSQGMPNLDINAITDENWEILFGGKEFEEPEPEPDPDPSEVGKALKLEVISDVLNIRSSPKVLTTNDIGDLHKGDVIIAKNLGGTDSWVEFEPGKWACFQKGTQPYLKAKE